MVENINKISLKIMFRMFLFAMILAFIDSGVSTYIDIRSDISSIEKVLEKLGKSYSRQLSTSLWNLDTQQLKAQVDGLSELESIQYLYIHEGKSFKGSKLFFEKGERLQYKVLGKKISLFYKRDNQKIYVGEFYIQMSLKALYNENITHLISNTLISFLGYAALIIILYFLLEKYVFSRIRDMEIYAKKISLDSLGIPLNLNNQLNTTDEIDLLAKSINQMRIHLKMSIDKMKRNDIRIINEADHMNSLIEKCPLMIISLTPLGKIQKINPIGEKILGSKLKDIKGESFWDVVALEDNENNNKIKKDLYNVEIKDIELTIFSKTETKYINLNSIKRKNELGQISEIIYFGNDITNLTLKEIKLKEYQEHLESIVEKRTAQIEQKNIELKDKIKETKVMQEVLISHEKLASLGNLTSGIAHELNNPLNFVYNFSVAAERAIVELRAEVKIKDISPEEIEESLEEIQQYLDYVKNHGERAIGIIKSMLLHSGDDNFKKEKVSFNEFIEEVIEIAKISDKEQLSGRDIEFKFDLDQSQPFSNISRKEISRVILNLISNSIYFLLEKSELTKDFHPQIKITTKIDGDLVVLSILDNGPGIKEHQQKHIFEPFYTTKPSGKGTGLGLSMGHEIISKLHGGEFTVESVPSKYTEFTIKLPIIL